MHADLSAVLKRSCQLIGALNTLVADELEKLSVRDLTSNLALMLYAVSERPLYVGKIRETGFGALADTGHALKKLEDAGYIERAPEGRRCLVLLTHKGRDVANAIEAAIDKSAKVLNTCGIRDEDMNDLAGSLSVVGYTLSGQVG